MLREISMLFASWRNIGEKVGEVTHWLTLDQHNERAEPNSGTLKDFGNLGSKQSWKVEDIYLLLSYFTYSVNPSH